MNRKNNLSYKYTHVFQLLENFNFNILSSRDMLCVLCHTIIKDSHQNICGCRYCYKCIYRYTESDAKYCPGHSDLCKRIIDKNNIISDQATNKKLLLLTVECPIEECEYKAQLKDMDEHIGTHREKCPFVGIGCQTSSNRATDLNEHMSHENKQHFTLLIGKINELQLQIDDNRAKIVPFDPIEIDNLKEICASQKSEIEMLKTEISDLKNTILSFSDSSECQKQKEMYIKDLRDLRLEIDDQNAAIQNLDKEFKRTVNELKNSKDDFDWKNEIKKINKSINSLNSEFKSKKNTDRIKSTKLAADILAVEKDAALMLSQFDLCRDDYKHLQKKLQTFENRIEGKSTAQKYDMGFVDKQLKSLQNNLNILEEHFEEEKNLAISFEDRFKTYEDDQKQLMEDFRRLEDDIQVVSEDLATSKRRLEAQVSELCRNTEIDRPATRELSTPYNWVIENFSFQLQQARKGLNTYITSEFFDYLDYRLGITLYPFGTDAYTGKYMSLLLFVYDAFSNEPVPIDLWITVSLVDQIDGSKTVRRRFHYSSVVKEEHTDSDNLTISTPLGAFDFIDLEILHTSNRYIKHNRLIIQADIEPWKYQS